MIKHTRFAVLFSVLLFTSFSQAFDSSLPQAFDASLSKSPNQIKIMTYNLLNLFDSQHDKGKDDHTFLSINHPDKEKNCKKIFNKHYRKMCLNLDWTEAKFQERLELTRKAILAQGDLPDLLAFQEIENENVMSQLIAPLGYKHFAITDSPDRRGIDVALAFKEDLFTYVEHEDIRVKGKYSLKIKPTRDILRVRFKLKKHPKYIFDVYVNHWPSQAAPSKIRYHVAKVLREHMEMHTKKHKDKYLAVALGDFNTLRDEHPNGITHVLQDPEWKHHFIDTRRLAFKKNTTALLNMPPFSYYYRKNGTWNHFDRILVTKNMVKGKTLALKPKTYRVGNQDFLMNTWNITNSRRFTRGRTLIPGGYDFLNKGHGGLHSDHLPVSVILEVVQ